MRLYHDLFKLVVPKLPFKFEINDLRYVAEQWQ